MPLDPLDSANNQYTAETPSISPPPSIGYAARLPEQGHELWMSLGSYIMQIDTLIEKAAVTLLKCQPFEPGRITVAWWKRDNAVDEDDKSPVPVIWNQRLDGVWYCKELSKKNLANRARRTGAFSKNHRLTVTVLSQLTILFDLRSRAVEIMRLEKIRVSALINQTQEKLDGIDLAVTEVMLDILDRRKSRVPPK